MFATRAEADTGSLAQTRSIDRRLAGLSRPGLAATCRKGSLLSSASRRDLLKRLSYRKRGDCPVGAAKPIQGGV
jgi:hypothetical protein